MDGEAALKRSVSFAPAMPLAFIVLWSTGYIGGAIGLYYAEPFTMTVFRFFTAAVLLLAISIATGAAWPRGWRTIGHIAMVGLLIQATQFAGLYSGIHHGVPAGIAALITGTMPLFTALGAGWLLGEAVTIRQWSGLALGLGGVTLVVSNKLTLQGADLQGLLLILMSLFGITAGTLYQKRFCVDMDLRTGGCIQLTVGGMVLLLLALQFESMRVDWQPGFVGSIAWLSIVNSIGAISLLYLMMRRGEASKVASLFYLIPPVTALMAAVVLGETLNPLAILGFAVAAAGVYIANRR